MPRKLFPEDRVHPAIREKIATNHHDIVDEVEAAIGAHDIVVVGMGQNPYPRRAARHSRPREFRSTTSSTEAI